MAHYFFQADYHGSVVTDDIGKEFATLQEADAHAAIIAAELGRNDKPVTISILTENGTLVKAGISAVAPAGHDFYKRAGTVIARATANGGRRPKRA